MKEYMKSLRRFSHSIILRFVTILLLIMVLPFTALLLTTTGEMGRIERERAADFLNSNLRIISAGADNLLSSVETGQTAVLMNQTFVSAVTGLAPYEWREEYPDFKAVQAIKSTIKDVSARNYKNDVIQSVYVYCPGARRLFISNVNWNPAYNQIALQ